MVTKKTLKFISEGFRQILLSEGVKSEVEKTTKKIKEKADANISGESKGFFENVWQGNYGGGRWIGSVSTTDAASMRAESEGKALSKAVSK